MNVIVLTGSLDGTASHHLPSLVKNERIKNLKVVYSRNLVKDKSGRIKRKIKKALTIGPFGALNGIRMRDWYRSGVKRYSKIGHLKEVCLQHDIALHTVDRICSQQCQELFTSFSPDIAISLGNGYICSKIFTIPKLGMINIHHEILPDYQNAQSVIWQLFNGSNMTGYTIHQIDKHIDTGKIVHQEHLPILFKDTLADTVSATVASLFDASAIGLSSVISNLEAKLDAAQIQENGGHYTTPSWSQMNRIKKNHERLRRAAQMQNST